MEKLYTCEEIAERYSVKVLTVWDWIRKRKLAASKIGKSYRVKESALVEFEECAEQKDPPSGG